MRNSEMRCYSRYYFFVFLFLIGAYKILTIDILMVIFFGTIWIPQIILNHVMECMPRLIKEMFCAFSL